MYEPMICLEGLCAQLCARRMDLLAKAELVKFQEAGNAVAASGDAEA